MELCVEISIVCNAYIIHYRTLFVNCNGRPTRNFRQFFILQLRIGQPFIQAVKTKTAQNAADFKQKLRVYFKKTKFTQFVLQID